MTTAEQTKQFLHDLFVHDASVKQEMGRAAAALGYGLPAEDYRRPFPGSQTTTNVTVTPPPEAPPVAAAASSALGTAGKVLGLGAAPTAAAAAIAFALMNYTHQQPAPPAPTAPAQVAPVPPEPVDLRVKWWIENGVPKAVVEPVGKEPAK